MTRWKEIKDMEELREELSFQNHIWWCWYYHSCVRFSYTGEIAQLEETKEDGC